MTLSVFDPVKIDATHTARTMTWREYRDALVLHEEAVFGATSPGYFESLPESPRSHSTVFFLIVGIFSGDSLVGWHYSHESAGEVLMRDTGLLPEHQGKGIYSQLLPTLVGYFVAAGFTRIRSRHINTNNAAIIPKLRFGFTVSGYECEGETQYVKLTYDASSLSNAQPIDRSNSCLRHGSCGAGAAPSLARINSTLARYE